MLFWLLFFRFVEYLFIYCAASGAMSDLSSETQDNQDGISVDSTQRDNDSLESQDIMNVSTSSLPRSHGDTAKTRRNLTRNSSLVSLNKERILSSSGLFVSHEPFAEHYAEKSM